MADLDLPAIGAQLDQGFQQLRARHESNEREVLEAMSQLRQALATDDRPAIAATASKLCDLEYSALGACELFGPVAEALVAAGLVPEDFDEQHVHKQEPEPADG